MTFLQAAIFNQYAFALHEPFNSYISQFKAGWCSFLKQKDLILNVGMISVQWGILYMFNFFVYISKVGFFSHLYSVTVTSFSHPPSHDEKQGEKHEFYQILM